MDEQFNLMVVAEAVRKRWKAIGLVTVITVIVAFVLTLPSIGVIEDSFESTSVVYASNSALSERPYLFESDEAVNINFSVFGSKYDVDRLIGIALSTQMREYVVEKFNLIEFFETKDDKYPLASAMSKLEDHYEVLRNEYDAMEITVKSKDRQLSADITNEIVSKMDEIHRGMVLESRNLMIANLEKHIDRKNTELEKLIQSIDQESSESLKKVLEMKQMLAMDQLMKYSDILDQFKLINSNELSTIFVMEKAIPAFKQKSFRSGLLVASLLISFFAAVFLATLLQIFDK